MFVISARHVGKQPAQKLNRLVKDWKWCMCEEMEMMQHQLQPVDNYIMADVPAVTIWCTDLKMFTNAKERKGWVCMLC